MKLLIAAILAGMCGCAAAQSGTAPPAVPPDAAARTAVPLAAALPALNHEARQVRLVTWNILGGRNTDGKKDLTCVAEVIRRLNPDLIALQEVDVKTKRIDGKDVPAELAQLTGMVSAFAEAMPFQGGSYGEAVLTRLKVTGQVNHPLPKIGPDDEPRAALELRCEIPGIGAPLIFIATHLDHQDDNANRMKQAARLRELFTAGTITVPAVLTGDMNAQAESDEMKLLGEFWLPTWPEGVPGATWPTVKPLVRIDHLLLYPRTGWKVVRTFRGDDAFPGEAAWRELLGKASDHLPVVLEVELPAKP